MPPLFSVVIPAYNQAEFLGDAINSVLSQTYPDFELIVVNDASPDHTEDVVRQFNDSRIKYIVHAQNKGLPSTRNTGIRASTGDFIALLDADDYFHPEKLGVHAQYMGIHSEICVTYNPRFELNHSAKTIRSLYRPKRSVDLSDLVLGFPFSPSDMVIRREWVDRVGLFDEALVNGAEDMDYPCRLALAGCKFASVDQVLNYRRYHLNRVHKNLHQRKAEYDIVLNRVLDDTRCPVEVTALRKKALAGHRLYLVFLAFAQGETEFGQAMLRKIVEYVPKTVNGNPSWLVNYLVTSSINHGEPDHSGLLKRILDQFPEEFLVSEDQYNDAVRRGFLIKGFRAAIWDAAGGGKKFLEAAFHLGAKIDPFIQNWLTGQICDISALLGEEATQTATQKVLPALKQFDKGSISRMLESRLLINRAFQDFNNGKISTVLVTIIKAVTCEPKLAFNRGVLSIFIKSLLKPKEF